MSKQTPAIDIHLKELKDTWGYTTEELNDIRERLLDVMQQGFWEGKDYRSDEFSFTSYGNTEDFI